MVQDRAVEATAAKRNRFIGSSWRFAGLRLRELGRPAFEGLVVSGLTRHYVGEAPMPVPLGTGPARENDFLKVGWRSKWVGDALPCGRRRAVIQDAYRWPSDG